MDPANNSAPYIEEEEVFFECKTNNTAQATSTPISESGKKRRRKTYAALPSPKKTRLRVKMTKKKSKATSATSEDEVLDEELSDAISDNDPTAFMASLAKQMAQMNRNMANMQQEWSKSVADAVAPISIKVDASISRLDKMEARHSAEISSLRETISDQINKAVEEKIASLTTGNGLDKTEERGGKKNASNGTYAGAAASAPCSEETPTKRSPQRTKKSKASYDEANEWFWNARRCFIGDYIYPNSH